MVSQTFLSSLPPRRDLQMLVRHKDCLPVEVVCLSDKIKTILEGIEDFFESQFIPNLITLLSNNLLRKKGVCLKFTGVNQTIGVPLENIELATDISANDLMLWSRDTDTTMGRTDFREMFGECCGMYPEAGDHLPTPYYARAQILGDAQGHFIVPLEYLWMEKEICEIAELFRQHFSPSQLHHFVPIVQLGEPSFTAEYKELKIESFE